MTDSAPEPATSLTPVATVTPAGNPYHSDYPGNLFMVVAPSGAGKSTLVNALLAQDSAIGLSVSYTTRLPRPGEQHGGHYHFVGVDEFLERRARGEFLESAEVHGNYYATSRLWIEAQMKGGRDVLLEIDWQGAQQVRKQFRNAVGVFVLPPSLGALEERLRKRGQDTSHVIVRRLLAAGSEIGRAPEFEYVVINENFDQALAELSCIVAATRLRFASQRARHSGLFVELGIHSPQME